MNEESVSIKGHLKLDLHKKDGRVITTETDNTVSTFAKQAIIDKILASPTLTEKPGWMEVGTSTPASTLLGGYIASSRTALDSKTRSGAVVTMICTFAAGVGTGTITEAGVFDVVTQNTVNMWCSASFGAVTKAAGDSLVITWTLTLS